MKVVSISSFVIHEQISLKLTLQYFGAILLPVPAQIYSAPMSTPIAVGIPQDVGATLTSTLKICAQRGESVILHIGFLANAQQVDDILNALTAYHVIIAHVVVDPVMGDHGKIYEKIDKTNWWKRLLPYCDLTIPNYTELCLLTGTSFEEVHSLAVMNSFKTLYPSVELVVTSISSPPIQPKREIGIGYFEDNKPYQIVRPIIGSPIGGTGDLFTLGMIDHYYFRKKTINQAIIDAHELVVNHIIKRQQTEINELLIF